MRIDKALDDATRYLRYGEAGGYNADSTIVRLMHELQKVKDRFLTQVRMKINARECAEDFFGAQEWSDGDYGYLEFIDNLSGQEIWIIYDKNNSFEYNDNNYCIPDCCFEFA